MKKYGGLHFRKMDLHVHTPASHDFSEKVITPEQIVQQCLSMEMSAIAVTDHNTGEYIDKIKPIAEKQGLVVIPGVEVTCSGGENGIHIIALFSCDKGKEHINSLLTKLDILEDRRGKKEAVTGKSVDDAITIIGELGGLAILAHCTSSKGVLNEIKGEQRKLIFNNKYLLAVETSYNDFIDKNKIERRTRAVDLLDGKNPDYCYRKLGVYVASDSMKLGEDKHTLEGIGSKFSFFKTDDEITLESLRQCFIDPNVRIITKPDFSLRKYPFIKSVSVDSGFFAGEEAIFHEGLNSIIGAKGAGKSLLIELMRFGLYQPPTQNVLFKDHNSKIEKRLLDFGTVKIVVDDGSGEERTITRRYTKNSNDTTNINFPVLFLSQNEIINVAENDEEQIRFIDRFLDFNSYLAQIKILESELSQLDIQFAESVDAIYNVSILEEDLNNLIKDIEPLNKKLENKKYDEYIKVELVNSTIDLQLNNANNMLNLTNDLIITTEDFSIAQIDDEISDEPIIKRNQENLNSTVAKIKELLQESKKSVQSSIEKITKEKKEWSEIFKKAKTAYEDFIKQDGDRTELENLRKKKLLLINETKEKLGIYKRKSDQVRSISDKRNRKLSELEEVYNRYTQDRIQKCKYFESVSNGRLKIDIKQSSNVDNFKQQLLTLKRGSYFRDDEVEAICERVTPKAFIHKLMQYHASRGNEANRNKKLSEISEVAAISQIKAKELFDFLLAAKNLYDLLKMQYTAIPQDRPDIKVKIQDDYYLPISEVSTGQKCTAMLIMALSQGEMPVIIDQPEDSLDMRSIWEDMCVKIRRNKDKRQFIFTTHNSSLAVASDTDKFIVVQGTAKKGEIICSGSMDSQCVKEQVVDYLEGKKETYFKKYEKYNL